MENTTKYQRLNYFITTVVLIYLSLALARMIFTQELFDSSLNNQFIRLRELIDQKESSKQTIGYEIKEAMFKSLTIIMKDQAFQGSWKKYTEQKSAKSFCKTEFIGQDTQITDSKIINIEQQSQVKICENSNESVEQREIQLNSKYFTQNEGLTSARVQSDVFYIAKQQKSDSFELIEQSLQLLRFEIQITNGNYIDDGVEKVDILFSKDNIEYKIQRQNFQNKQIERLVIQLAQQKNQSQISENQILLDRFPIRYIIKSFYNLWKPQRMQQKSILQKLQIVISKQRRVNGQIENQYDAFRSQLTETKKHENIDILLRFAFDQYIPHSNAFNQQGDAIKTEVSGQHKANEQKDNNDNQQSFTQFPQYKLSLQLGLQNNFLFSSFVASYDTYSFKNMELLVALLFVTMVLRWQLIFVFQQMDMHNRLQESIENTSVFSFLFKTAQDNLLIVYSTYGLIYIIPKMSYIDSIPLLIPYFILIILCMFQYYLATINFQIQRNNQNNHFITIQVIRKIYMNFSGTFLQIGLALLSIVLNIILFFSELGLFSAIFIVTLSYLPQIYKNVVTAKRPNIYTSPWYRVLLVRCLTIFYFKGMSFDWLLKQGFKFNFHFFNIKPFTIIETSIILIVLLGLNILLWIQYQKGSRSFLPYCLKPEVYNYQWNLQMQINTQTSNKTVYLHKKQTEKLSQNIIKTDQFIVGSQQNLAIYSSINQIKDPIDKDSPFQFKIPQQGKTNLNIPEETLDTICNIKSENKIQNRLIEYRQCSICLVSLSQDVSDFVTLDSKYQKKTIGLKLMKTPCNHKYHALCLIKWMSNKMDCPQCRAKLPAFQ